jgi:hypothetical protein
MAKWWLHWKKFKAINVTNAVALWATFGKSRNDMCFQGGQWRRMEKLNGRCACVIRKLEVGEQGSPCRKIGGLGR